MPTHTKSSSTTPPKVVFFPSTLEASALIRIPNHHRKIAPPLLPLLARWRRRRLLRSRCRSLVRWVPRFPSPPASLSRRYSVAGSGLAGAAALSRFRLRPCLTAARRASLVRLGLGFGQFVGCDCRLLRSEYVASLELRRACLDSVWDLGS
jgi:hypothetical protein